MKNVACLIMLLGSLPVLFFASHERLSRVFGLPDITTPVERWNKHTEARTSYCGRLGNSTFDFPRMYTEWTVQYEGDNPWDGRDDWSIKGCSDNFEGLGFRFVLPEVVMVTRTVELDNRSAVRVSLSQGTNPRQVLGMLDYYRGIRAQPDAPDQFERNFGLYYFDVDNYSRDRIFWRAGKKVDKDLYIDCSVLAKNPQCSLHVVSEELGSHIVISMAMANLDRWSVILKTVEAKLSEFKVLTQKEVD